MQRCMKLEHQYAVTLFNKGRERHVQAILDTGNHLMMPLSGRPVQVLDACAAERFFSWEDGVQYIPFRSVGKGGGVIPAYQAERMEEMCIRDRNRYQRYCSCKAPSLKRRGGSALRWQ